MKTVETIFWWVFSAVCWGIIGGMALASVAGIYMAVMEVFHG